MPPNRHSPILDQVQGLQGRYSSPRNSTPTSMVSDSYDVPPRAIATPTPSCYDTPVPAVPLRPALLRRESQESYDVPRPIGTRSPLSAVMLMQQRTLTPSSSASSLTADSVHSAPSSNRSSVASSVASSLASCGNEYDVPRSARVPSALALSSQTYDVPPAATPASTHAPRGHHGPHHGHHHHHHHPAAPAPAITPRELPLELGSALETLARLQGEATSAVSRLLGFAGPQWRHREKLEPCLMDIKLAVVRLRTALHDLTEFGEGAFGNAARASDKGLVPKLRPLIKALCDADRLVHETTSRLDALDWSLDALCRDEEESGRRISPDALDQLVACAQALTEDVRQAASTIQGNSTLLFKRASSPNGSTHSGNGEWLEDYDYVNLESKETVAKQNAEIIEDLPEKLRKSFDGLVKETETLAVSVPPEPENAVDADDIRILSFYAGQIVTHSAHLTHAIDAFLQTVEHNQPPKVFLAHSKFVVLSAHWLVQVGDTVHRNVARADVRSRVLSCTNALSEALGSTVHRTKKAALQFPSVTAVQEMVDSVVDISHLARDLKLSMVQASQQL
ncbi:breast cancer anti-estrogen resistance protein 1 [Frankliniella occidentalis]|uniref:Breast cancer anti-estrogen resistance protein 1 n=1 Tax=Frankliniella occidentalis TaxID=133901 RepID=A0A9C6XU40_FRAOC|nr:breast cancer anti-estrogen resistance protein 1 [Frankliniella occidentalis]